MKIKTLFRILVTPSCWLRNRETDNDISAFINNALDNGCTIVIIDRFTVKLDGLTLWVRNYPYSFGYDCTYSSCSGLPDRETVFRLYDELQKIKSK